LCSSVSYQVSHFKVRLDPAVTGMLVDVDLALLWHAISLVPYLLGSTNPRRISAKCCRIDKSSILTVVLVQGKPAGSCYNLVGG